MRVTIIEPFFVGSHAAWATGYASHSRHDVDILKLSGNHWKWRMHGGAVTLARRFLEGGVDPDVIVATDMLDLTTFLALTRERTSTTPTAIYFHENQITYPWSPKDRDLKRDRDKHYGFINVASALAADRVFYNSRYHMESFLDSLPRFLGQFPDHQEMSRIEEIAEKSSVLSLGLDLRRMDDVEPIEDDRVSVRDGNHPVLLWNHRWEYDKNPDEFFSVLTDLFERNRPFGLVVLGEQFDVIPDGFRTGLDTLSERVIHSGYTDSRDDYARWLRRCDVVPVTSHHDFFGASVVEAMYCGCVPLLPRRLAYPELIPDEFHARCFYDGADDLTERLDGLITTRDKLDSDPFRAAASRFDWNVMAPIYDEALEQTAAAK